MVTVMVMMVMVVMMVTVMVMVVTMSVCLVCAMDPPRRGRLWGCRPSLRKYLHLTSVFYNKSSTRSSAMPFFSLSQCHSDTNQLKIFTFTFDLSMKLFNNDGNREYLSHIPGSSSMQPTCLKVKKARQLYKSQIKKHTGTSLVNPYEVIAQVITEKKRFCKIILSLKPL